MMAAKSLVYVGCQPTSAVDAPSLFTFQRQPDNGLLSPVGHLGDTDKPLFLAADSFSSRIYSLSDDGRGFLNAFARDPESGALRHLCRVAAAGRGPCHAVALSSSYLAVANYGGGNVTIHPCEPSGAIGPPVQVLARNGKGKDPVRQDGPHPHAVVVVPRGDRVAVADLGLDELVTYPFTGGTTPFAATPAISPAGPGRGPRRVLFAGENTAYVVNELSSSLSSYRYDADTGTFSRLAECSTIIGQQDEQENYPADVCLSSDGSYLYVTNRGRHTVATFTAGADSLLPVAEVSTGGEWPLALLSIGTHLYVANQYSDNVTVFRLHATSGVPEPIQQVPVPGPTCLLAR